MKLHLDRLTQSPTEHEFSASPEWWRESAAARGADVEALREPIEFRVRGHRMGEDVFLEGEATGQLELACSRCLERYRQPLREPFRLVLEPAGQRVPADPEGAAAFARDGLFLSDELEAGWFRGREIDLGTFFQEVIALLFPVQPLCREECRGLCPQCGVDRNRESCDCAEASTPSPFAKLRALREAMSGGDKG